MMGGDLTYTYISGNSNSDTYDIEFAFYRDCDGISAPSSATIYASSSCSSTSASLTRDACTPPPLGGVPCEITQLCPQWISQSTCNGGTLAGTQRYVYRGTINLPHCADWVLSYSGCCRNSAITNLASTSTFYIEATLNNTNNLRNSAPMFSNLPVPYVCAGQPFNFNHGAFDIDGDSLVYSLIQPRTGPTSPIGYNFNYTPAQPLGTSTGVTLDPVTGQLSFTANGNQVAVISLRVEEIRAGQIVGSTMRELQVIVMSNCNTQQPNVSTVQNLGSSAALMNPTTVNVCAGGTVNFFFNATDPDLQDSVFLSTNLPIVLPTANLSTQYISNNTILAHFNWQSTVADTGINVFTVTVVDDGCPILGSQTFSFAILVVKSTYASDDTVYFCEMGGPELVSATGGSHFSWTPTTGIVWANGPDSSQVMVAPTQTMYYYVESDLDSQHCKWRDTILVIKVPDFAHSLTPGDTICKNQSTQLISLDGISGAPYTYEWTPTTGISSSVVHNPLVNPLFTTTYYTSITSSQGCDIVDSSTVVVSGASPVVTVLGDHTICYGDSTPLEIALTDSLISEDFDGPIAPGIWVQNDGISSAACGAVSGNALYFNGFSRILETTDFNLADGATLSFQIKIATGSAPCDNADNGEDVVLEYSMDGGNSWTVHQTYYQGSYPVFTPIAFIIPPGAFNQPLRLRWRQTNFTSAGQDNWMLDDIRLLSELNSNFTFQWTPAIGISQPQDQSTLAFPIMDTTYTVFVDDTMNQCDGLDTFTMRVGQDFQAIASNDTNLCTVAGIPISVSHNSSTSVTYEWSPNDSLSNPFISGPMANPSQSTTYQVEVTSADGCSRSDDVHVNVLPIASFVVTPDSAAICVGDSIQLGYEITNRCGTNNTPCLGGGSSSVAYNSYSSSSSSRTPFCGAYLSSKRQYIFTQSELSSLGMTSGKTINRLTLSVNAVYGSAQYDNFTIKMGCTQKSIADGNFISGLYTVFDPQIINIAPGPIHFFLDHNYDWDGVSNLVVEICYSNAATSQNSRIEYHGAGFYASTYTYNIAVCADTTGWTSSYRPNIQFGYCNTPATMNLLFNWSPSTGISNHQIANPTASPTSFTNYVLTATDTSTGCKFQDDLNISAGPHFNVDITGDSAICNQTGVVLTANHNATGSVNYQWSPAGLFQNHTLANPLVNSSSDTSVLLQVLADNGCIERDTFNLQYSGFIDFEFTPDDSTICPGLPIQTSMSYSSHCGTNGTLCTGVVANATIGSGTYYSSSSYRTPFAGGYISSKRQYLLQTSELNTAGLSGPSTLTQLAFNVLSAPANSVYENFTIKLGCTSISTTTNNFVQGLTTVFDPGTINLNNGWNTFVFNRTFDWDGSSNLIVEICYLNSNTGSNASVYLEYISYDCVTYRYGSTPMCSEPTGYDYYYRPFMRFGHCSSTSPQGVAYSWSPTIGVSNANIAEPIITPVASNQYIITVTDTSSGCLWLDTMDIITSSANLSMNTLQDTTLCSTLGYQFNLGLAQPNTTYSWSPGNLLNNASIPNPIITADTSATFVVHVSNPALCLSESDTVTVNYANSTFHVSEDTTICSGDTVTLSASGGLVYSWNNSNGLDSTHIPNPMAFPLNTSQYFVTISDSFGCTYTDSVQVTVRSLLDFVNLGPDTTTCGILPVTFDAGQGFDTYNWNTGYLGQTFTAAQTGIYSVTATNQCAQAIDSVEMTVAPIPQFNLGNDTIICTGNSVTLSPDTFDSGWVHSWSNGTTTLANTVNVTGVYTLTAVSQANCVYAETMQVLSLPTPYVHLGNDTSLCIGETLVIEAGTAGNGYVYLWNDSSTASDITVSNSGTYSVSASIQQCVAHDSITVQFHPQPQVNLGVDTGVCPSDQVLLDAGQTNGSYNWNGGAQSQTLTVQNPGSYAVTITENGCSGSDTVEVFHHTVPVVNLGSDIDLCDGNATILNAGNPGSTYQWSIGDLTQQVNVNTPGLYTVHVHNGFCASKDSVLVTVHSNPIVNLGPDTTICDGNSMSISLDSTAGSYLWNFGSSSSSTTMNSSGAYSVTITDNNGCQGSDTVNILVTPLPEIQITADTFVCEGSSLQLNAAGGTQYSWSSSHQLSNPNVSNPLASPTSPTTFWVTVETSSGCIDSISVSVDIHHFPQIELGEDVSICAGALFSFEAPKGYDSYQWSTGSTSDQISVGTQGQYWVEVSNECGGVFDTIAISEVHPLPLPNLGNDTTLCENSSLNISASVIPGNYAWSTGATTSSIIPNSSGLYVVEMTDEHGCQGADSISVWFTPAPVANLGKDTTLCFGESLWLTADNGTAHWNTGDNENEIIVNSAGEYAVLLSDPSQICPPDLDTIEVSYEDCYCFVWVPNAFSPNNDGRNDFFKPEINCDIRNYSFSVFNRWGEMLFRTYDPENSGWDGSYKGNREQQDVYVYVIEYSGVENSISQHEKKTGSITLLR